MEISWLPRWLGHWADRNGELRTAVPFFMLSAYLAIEAWIGFSKSCSLANLAWLLGAFCLIALLTLTEVLQLVLPLRHFDWADIGFGMIGTLLGGFPLLLRALFFRPKVLSTKRALSNKGT